MLHAYDQRFDVTENLKIFCKLNRLIPKYFTNMDTNSMYLMPQTKVFSRPCLVHPKNQIFFKMSRYIESCGTCMEY